MSAWTKEIIGRGGHIVLGSMKKWLESKPTEVVHSTGAKYGKLFGRLVRRRTQIVHENLQRAFPELSEKERDALSVHVFEHFGSAAADFLACEKRTLKDIEDTTDVTGFKDAFDAALAKGKGVIFASGHFGNWERLPQYLSMSGYRVTVITRDADQEGVNTLVNRLREHSGTTIVPRGSATRAMVQALRKNEIIGILADQNADDVFLPFFGYPTGTAKGLGVIAVRTGAAIVPCACVHLGSGRYRMHAESEFKPIGEDTVLGEANMRAYNNWLEGLIRKYPEQWLWLHDRWRASKERGLI